MRDINQAFKDAINLHNENEKGFLPLIEHFEELKKVLQSNFLMRQKKSTWYGKTNWVVKPTLNLEIEDKITHSTGKYLFIRINGKGYVMGIGEIGELKDELYFCYGSMITRKNDVIVHITSSMFGTTDYALENKITLVQLFSFLIKEYNNYLVKGT